MKNKPAGSCWRHISGNSRSPATSGPRRWRSASKPTFPPTACPKLVGVLDLVRPGGRIVDFKTSGKTPDPEQVAHTTAGQTTAYGLLYREATGNGHRIGHRDSHPGEDEGTKTHRHRVAPGHGSPGHAAVPCDRVIRGRAGAKDSCPRPACNAPVARTLTSCAYTISGIVPPPVLNIIRKTALTPFKSARASTRKGIP